MFAVVAAASAATTTTVNHTTHRVLLLRTTHPRVCRSSNMRRRAVVGSATVPLEAAVDDLMALAPEKPNLAVGDTPATIPSVVSIRVTNHDHEGPGVT